MKVCTKCKKSKDITRFTRHKHSKDGLSSWCKECSNSRLKAATRTKSGFVGKMYNDQRSSCKRRGHDLPEYTKKELLEWLMGQELYHELFDIWVESGYKKILAPSVDRLDDYKTYSFDNIQLTDWFSNKEKAHKDRKNGINNKVSRLVNQYGLDGEFINTYHSIRKASRVTSVPYQNISSACNGMLKSAGGFKWKFGAGGVPS